MINDQVVTLGSAINSFIGVDLASENQEGVALLPSKEAHGSWALLAAPPGTNASPNVPPLYYLKSTKERWLSSSLSSLNNEHSNHKNNFFVVS